MMMLVAVVLLVLVLVIALVVPDIMYCLGGENEDRIFPEIEALSAIIYFCFQVTFTGNPFLYSEDTGFLQFGFV